MTESSVQRGMRRALAGAALFVAGAAGVAAAQDEPDPTERLARPEPLFAARARAGWYPVRVRLENRGARAGNLRFHLADPGGEGPFRYRLAADLAPGATRPAIAYAWGRSHPYGGSAPPGELRLFASDGWRSRPTDPSWRRTEGLEIAALLAPDEGGARGAVGLDLPWPSGTFRPAGTGPKGTVRARLVPVAPGGLPEHVVGWDPVDALLVSSGAPLDAVSVDERAAILQWCALGGVVIVSGTATAASLASPLVDDLCGPFHPALATLAPGPADPLDAPVAAATRGAACAALVGCPPGFETVEAIDGQPVLCHRAHGRGHVYYCAIDLGGGRGGPDAAPILAACVRHARDRQRLAPDACGERWPGLPSGEERYREEVAGVANQNWGWQGGAGHALDALADGVHTGRERLPSPWAVLTFLAAYVVALGPGVWWLRRRLGGGLTGVPVRIGVAVAFAVGGIGFGLATRGIGLVTQRVTYLFPLPGRPDAGETTVLSCYAGWNRRIDARFPGAVAPLPLAPDGRVGAGFAFDVSLGPDAAVAHGVPLGAWQTRRLLAEGFRPIGGAIACERPVPGRLRVINRSALHLRAGAWWLSDEHWVPVPALPPGGTAEVEEPENSAEARKGDVALRAWLGLPEPHWAWTEGLLAPARGLRDGGGQLARQQRIQARFGQTVVLPAGTPKAGAGVAGPVYVACAEPVSLVGGGPTVEGETRLRDLVCVVVPLGDAP